MSIKLYQMVKVTEDFEILKAGTVGQVFAFEDDLAGIRMGRDFLSKHPDVDEFAHSIGGNSDNYDGWWVPPEKLTPVRVKRIYEVPKTKRCCKCGKAVREGYYYEVGEKALCSDCAAIKSYSTKNNKQVNKPTKSGKTYGFEFECTCSEKNRNFVTAQNWGMIPTSDASLPSSGVEFKTPTYNGLRGVRNIFKVMNTKVRFSSGSCGQHINIGDKNWLNARNMQVIRDYKEEIFTNLLYYLKNHPNETKKVIGRSFGQYRTDSMAMTHGCWINLNHDNRIEFRMSKFVTPDQYFGLTVMWTEMINSIISNVLKCNTEAERISGSRKASAELVTIFKKHYNGMC